MKKNNNSGEISQFLLYTILFYGVVSYLVLPIFLQKKQNYRTYQDLPKITFTKHGIPGDPINVGMVGTPEQVVGAMFLAGWYPADSVTLRSVFKVSKSVILNRRYLDAPVSSLYVWGREQDLAFERAVGRSPRKRHHARFWISDQTAEDGRPFWIGDATFDRSVGLSHYTFQVTHHIDADVDEERDTLIEDMKNAGVLSDIYQIEGVGPMWNARNGGGDPYFTDGKITIGIISPKMKGQ